MNPALDVSSEVDHVVCERKLRCGPAALHPGGGGVNVSRAIANLGGRSTAVYPLGGPTGATYHALAASAGVAGVEIAIAESTRENFTVTDRSTGEQFRFILPGPTLQEAEWTACLSALEQCMPHGGFLVASGSLPPGTPTDFYAVLARAVEGSDVRLVVDASGPALTAALEEKVFLIKPSADELAELIGTDHSLTPDEQVHAARSIVGRGNVQIVALTLGAAGALLVTSSLVLRLATPPVSVVSAVGAGDAFLAGLVLRLAEGITVEGAFRTAVAAGSATAAMPATELCRAADVERLEHLVLERAPEHA
ncbi:1-phosphofructokinase family hexose kinase [Microbacterium rhizomatis]|uniref:1-phosphofructokinase family hexose kinase n=2 Tax=Microbacterium rhizomatis TaxID=1631477 RepID=A0A5J5J8D7_9MICO|nr:1-phosphofructokinase family hexose kinase [Microbacterium rhizomatis]